MHPLLSGEIYFSQEVERRNQKEMRIFWQSQKVQLNFLMHKKVLDSLHLITVVRIFSFTRTT